jgi:hypothetical protein
LELMLAEYLTRDAAGAYDHLITKGRLTRLTPTS